MSTFLAYLKLVPALLEAVIAIERAVPIPGQGKAKLELILAIAQQLAAEIKEIPLQALLATTGNIVTTLVSFLNAVGVFTTKPK
jgi:hypothetical protein